MARRVRFSIAQPVTITGWYVIKCLSKARADKVVRYISSFTLVGLTAAATGPLRLGPSTTWAFTPAFYYAIIAASLYFVCASLMVVTVVGAYKGRYDKDFKLTTSQRTLMLQTIGFLVYLLLGALVYSHIEDWLFLDAVYFADFTLLTIGIGDLAPVTNVGRGLLFPFAIGGIIILGLVVASIRSLVLERGKVKLGARLVEKERQRILKEIDKSCQGLLIPINDEKSKASTAGGEEEQREFTERQRREMEFQIMRKIQERAATRRKWVSLAISASTWFALWFAGAAIFQVNISICLHKDSSWVTVYFVSVPCSFE
jgi:potassium channel subfamily K